MAKKYEQLALDKRNPKAQEFEDSLRRKIIGQDDAIKAITEIYETHLAGIQAPCRPIGNLLFMGPSGSGKTRCVEAVAETLYNDPRAMIKIDCAEFQHSHEIAKLIGSPPGYLGHRETPPMLTDGVLRAWWTEQTQISLILFDEIEKASDALWNLLLGILDKAILTAGDNTRTHFDKAIIFMTSNVGSSHMAELMSGGMGFGAPKARLDDRHDGKVEDAALAAMKRKFSPEFVNRIDKTVVFKTLRQEHIRQILEIELGAVQQRFLSTPNPEAPRFVFTCSQAVKDQFIADGVDARYGARFLKRIIETRLVYNLARLSAAGQIETGNEVLVDVDPEGKLTFARHKADFTPAFELGAVKQAAVAATASGGDVVSDEEVKRILQKYAPMPSGDVQRSRRIKKI